MSSMCSDNPVDSPWLYKADEFQVIELLAVALGF